MTDHITPEEARALISRAEGYADSDYTTIDMLVDTNMNRLGRIAWNMAEMISWARVEYAIARKNDGVTEYLADWGWTDFRSTAEWHWSPPEHEPGPDERIITRLVIDLEEEE
ncbi:hypothetical protein [Corynebacterium sanguinis]|uniref:hypothetical protein n=1 Tax=Corynebacterium sanguinis TaxID=2594913 RepID=UPI0021A5535C|nr:hypothetical protein [Corynebacterium sanguinis]MCT1411675.1 hypothetical protein [Corynebacterium sanguinis]